ncbi:sugar-binding domain-containing protein [Pelagicoccus sp. SDUM812005]|uniref:sugar-binding domain-containing protein n=1 Tax=Pelagicoccus sp. SDUM812005 TaxID=3041257 RepID=UPI00280F58E1|nr:sugar-binding domain-containing protein [Pelagicoccus sp. SDUM812005]MDQ8183784.1 glycoside hydrolase family 2 TIM barrel-domain containing protein [Pelagicoccus sp. SDUM812005]
MDLFRRTTTLITLFSAITCVANLTSRETISLNDGWRFHLGDAPDAQDPAYDDSRWQAQDIPHDWAFRAPYDRDAAQSDKGGYKPGGIGWYRRTLDIPTDWKDKIVRINFDGIYMDSRIWVNGKEVGGRPYGYISFGIDLTDHLQAGENQIAIRVDNSLEPSARWYHPCGIYAPASLVVTNPLHVAPNGVFVQTPEISDREATVSIATNLAATPPKGATLTTRVLDPSGKEVASSTRKLQGQKEVTQSLSVLNPKRWDTLSPQLYTAVSEIALAGKIVDSVETRFGIRTIRWETETGFWLNGRNVKLKGVSDHLEAGPLGGEAHAQILRWKVQLLKNMGVNAIRVAHNPQVPEFYRICDELGMLVMDEIFDGWLRKAPQDYGARFFEEHWKTDLTDWVKRDRNHPCVIIYSVGNETRGPVAPELVAAIKELDTTRPVTSGHSGSEHMDVYGVNGSSEKRQFFEEERPDKPFVSTEAPHTWQVRGYYRTKTWWRDGYPNKNLDPFPLEDLTEEEIFTYDWAPASEKTSGKQVFNSSYDNATVRITARKNWELMRDLPWFSGHFRWTGFDYVGEAGYVHGGWPFRAFMGGPLDLAGFEKDLFYFYQSQWTEEPMVHILPHWTHPKMETGTLIPVWAYSNADVVELFLNGRSLGIDRPGLKAEEMQCEWYVPWEPGTLEAVAYKNGKEVARARQATAQAPSQIQIESNKSDLETSIDDLAIVTVSQLDDQGVFYPYGENRLSFHLEGPARILSLENGNPIDTEPNFGQTTRRAFFGLARAFIQATGQEGEISLTVGAINGERRQLTSNLVSIDIRQINLRGTSRQLDLTVRYTTDGSMPTAQSQRYEAPFKVELGTSVKAAVYNGDRQLFTIEESFASDVGLHWLTPGESTVVPGIGLQAEDATVLDGTTTSANIAGHYGTGYAILPQKGKLQFYQENDGSFGPHAHRIRYQSDKDTVVHLISNGRNPVRIALPASPSTWSKVMVRSNIVQGGNNIILENTQDATVLIDEIEISSNY